MNQVIMLLIIDNYDSFTFNLLQYFGELGCDTKVFRNDKITLKEVEKLKPRNIVISPGPGAPDNAGISLAVINHFLGKVPILGVCLGHQCIGKLFNGKIVYARKIVHGKTSKIYHAGKGVFNNIKQPFHATRYHSLVVDKDSLPDCLEITAWTQQDEQVDEIMGIRHKLLPLEGVQFHPESIMTVLGHQLLKNFLEY